MALRLPANLHTYASLPCKKSGASSCSSSGGGGGGGSSRRRFSGINLIVCSSSLDKQRRRVGGAPTVASPLQVAEELAARFGHEMAVADLERLYREYDRGDGPPAFSDPGSPGRPLRVVYQGVRGSYCQEAAAAAFNSSTAAEDSGRFSFLPCSNMEDAFAALEDGSADRAVAPMENSIDGPIHRNLDLLIRHPGVRIVGELILPVDHCLLTVPGARRSALRSVVSHPQALAHCRERLGSLGLEIEEAPNAASAAEWVAENGIRDTAVIGSEMAAREFGLQVLERNFQDQPPGANVNRYLQLALGSGKENGKKTTVAFSLERGPSDLFRALWTFESRGVRVSRVDHRPNRANPIRVVEKATNMDYVYFLDLEGPESDPRVKSGIRLLHEFAGFVRVLGSYDCTCRTRLQEDS
ncbi:hypothetical protein OPV22_014908 [Ensete ventricosum]|uniref:Prephenate dehydratase domain-containing protein n=1 Tax=Ensete ventricosum TaxID=4639 RepID=A0AAV8R937_ENSVE|nr:hypothetical protein OPV22_014908 [Ensete ventricosum]